VRVVLVGPPGAGKGTQAHFIAAHLDIPKISTGDLFRANVSRGTPLGLEAKKFMDAGDLVPDEITIAMVRARLAEDDAKDGFLLDGFPRNVHQAAVLDGLLADLGVSLDLVLDLEIDAEEVVHRLAGRRTCRACGNVSHVDFDPPPKRADCPVGRCDQFQRDDDREETVRRRLEVYTEQTAPLVGYYDQRGILRGIDALGPVEEVTRRSIDALTAEPA
jgi:adenylate kinase